MARSGFKLRSGNNTSGSSFKMMGSSPIPKIDVKVGEEVFTGDEAYNKGLLAEAKRTNAWNEGGPESLGIVGAGKTTQKDIDATKERNRARAERQSISIEYTGDDAHKRINESDWNFEGGAEAKEKAHAQVRAGGSYTP